MSFLSATYEDKIQVYGHKCKHFYLTLEILHIMTGIKYNIIGVLRLNLDRSYQYYGWSIQMQWFKLILT